MKNYSNRLRAVQKILADKKITHFILPNSDQFFLEYLPESEKRIQYLSGFTGSNATIILGKKCQFFTDGRYTLQAKNELDVDDYEIFNIATTPLFAWVKANLKKAATVAIDAKLVSVNFVRALQKIIDEVGAKLVFVEVNPVDEIWKNRPSAPQSPVFFHDLKFSGVNSKAKVSLILQGLRQSQKIKNSLPNAEKIADAILFSRPESICWLLNIRASDVEFTPLLAAYAILFKNGKVDLFVDENRLNEAVKLQLKNVNFIAPSMLEARIGKLQKQCKTIQIDPATTNFWLHNLFAKKFTIVEKADSTSFPKACKNKIEISGAVKSHKIDGLAVTKFLYWLEKNNGAKPSIDELQAEEQLLKFRQESPHFLYPSFNSISSFAANGAVIHYHSSPKTNKKLLGNSLYLIDSGGQYQQGTTDITRVVAIGVPTTEMKRNFTLVLQGHIALATAKFSRTTTGVQLDALARGPLQKAGLDYDHGTGHGVGSFLSVHEGPCSISKRGQLPLSEGMILSNEPGFYKEGAYGIRIENLMLVEKCTSKKTPQSKAGKGIEQDLLQFKTLTLAPLDHRLINFTMLNKSEKIWLKNYHKKVYLTHKKHLNKSQQAWLQAVAEHFAAA